MPVQFDSGAVRGTIKATGYYMLSEAPFRRYAAAMTEGVAKYPRYNWLKGIPADNLFDHLMDHLFKFLAGDSTEDHLGHAMWNLGTLIYFAEERPDLFADMPPGCLEACQRWAEELDANNPDPLTVQTGHESNGCAALGHICPNCHMHASPGEPHTPDKHVKGTCEILEE